MGRIATTAVPGPRRSVPASPVGPGAAGAEPDQRSADPAAHDLVVRQRLLDQVSRGVRGPLTLVSAPAGTGKSALLASWRRLGRSTWPSVWVSLQVGDEVPAAFRSRLLDAVRDSGLDVSCAAGPTEPAEVAAGIVGRLAHGVAGAGTPVVLVLDGLDRLGHPGGCDEVTELMRACGPSLRLVLLSRSDPALPLHLYRLAGTITEIRADDLAFTDAETAELLNRRRAEDVAAVHGRCRGWAAGVRFAALHLERADPAEVVRELSRDGGDVSRYLRSEVLDTHPPVMRDVLLRTSVADRLDAGLIEELTGVPQGRQLLDRLVHGNALVERLTGGRGYRYHPLFADFLRERLSEEQPGLVRELHLLVAGWAARQGLLVEAARHSAAAGAWPEAAGHLVDGLAVGELLAGADSARLLSVFRGLPEDTPGVAAAVVRAAMDLEGGDLEHCGSETGRAALGLADEPEPRRRSAELAVAVVQSLLAERRGDIEAALAGVGAADGLLTVAQRDRAVDHPELLALLSGCRGRMLLRRGDLFAARAALAESARHAEQARSVTLLVDALGVGALVEAVNGRLRRSVDLAHRTTAAARDAATGRSTGVAAAATALAWVRMEQYDVATVAGLVEDASALLTRDVDAATAAALALVRARHELATGDLDAARAELLGLGAGAGAGPAAWPAVRVAAAAAGVLTAMGQDGPVPGPDQPAVRPVETTPLDVRLTDLLARAERTLRAKRPTQAEQLLERALRLAAPEHMRRPFFEAGPHVLRHLGPGTELAARHPWLGDTRWPAAGDGQEAGSASRRQESRRAVVGSAVLVEPLTPREREVLGLLAQLLTTEEIAERMFVSVNTVRTHVRSALRKLSATRRNEAVRRAWELQLLPRRTDVPRQGGKEPA